MTWIIIIIVVAACIYFIPDWKKIKGEALIRKAERYIKERQNK